MIECHTGVAYSERRLLKQPGFYGARPCRRDYPAINFNLCEPININDLAPLINFEFPIPNLNSHLKNQLLQTLSNFLKICTHNCHQIMFYQDLHSINRRATPTQFIKYTKDFFILFLFLFFNVATPQPTGRSSIYSLFNFNFLYVLFLCTKNEI